MPKEDETKTAYCKKCERETTWIYRIFMLGKEIWECLTCGTRYYV
jgi:ribosomal protein L37AE/L43A